MNFRFNAILTVGSVVPLVVGSVLFAFYDIGDSHTPIALDFSLGNDFWCNESPRRDSGNGIATGKDYKGCFVSDRSEMHEDRVYFTSTV